MASSTSEVVSSSILEEAEEAAKSLDWLSIPPEKRMVDDDLMNWFVFGDDETSILDDFNYFSDDSNKENVPGPSSDDGSSESVLESNP